MKMDDMNEYLEERGFEVNRTYNSKTGCYTFDICKDSVRISDDFKYHDPSSTLTLHTRQKKFLDNLIRLHKAENYYVTREDKDVLDAIKNLKPCKCGGVPEVTIDGNIASPYDTKTILCPKCGKKKSGSVTSLEYLVKEWNEDNEPEIVEFWRNPNKVQYGMFYNYGRTKVDPFEIDKVIVNEPAIIVFWKDGTKTVVKAIDEPFDEEKGLAMAIVKKAYGNKGNYFNKIKKWAHPKMKRSPNHPYQYVVKDGKATPLKSKEDN